MKKLISIIIFAAVMLIVGCSSSEPVFRTVGWEMSKADVLKAETVNVDNDSINTDYIVTFEETEVYDMPAYFVYMFDNDEKLCGIHCYFNTGELEYMGEPIDVQLYIDCYNKLVAAVSDEYGEPMTSQQVDDEISQNEYMTTWETEETKLTAGIWGLTNQTFMAVQLTLEPVTNNL